MANVYVVSLLEQAWQTQDYKEQLVLAVSSTIHGAEEAARNYHVGYYGPVYGGIVVPVLKFVDGWATAVEPVCWNNTGYFIEEVPFVDG